MTKRSESILWICLTLSAGAWADQPGKSPIKVFLMAGQSNMEGQAVVDLNSDGYNGGKGNLEYVMQNSPLKSRYAGLKDSSGKWAVWRKVWTRYRTGPNVLMKGDLSVGYTVYNDPHHFGTELQFGRILGDSLANQILLIKAAWGGRDLAVDFRPPSSGGTVGPFYTTMIQYFHEGLDNIAADFPGYDGKGYEIAGFVWFHGWNDHLDNVKTAQYETNASNLIKDIRKEFKVQNLPVVIGEETGVGAAENGTQALAMQKAQAAVAARAEFAGTVSYVKTAEFVRPAQESPNTGHSHHFYGNAETYFLIGDAFGKSMLKLLPRTTPVKAKVPTANLQATPLHLDLYLGDARGIHGMDFDLSGDARLAITIADMRGRVVHRRVGPSPSGPERIDLSGAGPGIYRVHVQGAKNVAAKTLVAF